MLYLNIMKNWQKIFVGSLNTHRYFLGTHGIELCYLDRDERTYITTSYHKSSLSRENIYLKQQGRRRPRFGHSFLLLIVLLSNSSKLSKLSKYQWTQNDSTSCKKYHKFCFLSIFMMIDRQHVLMFVTKK